MYECSLPLYARFADSIEEIAQNGRGVKRPAQRLSEFLHCLAARSRALWAFREGLVASIRRWHDDRVRFTEELASVLPPDVPHRDVLIRKAARHLSLIAVANEHMNLTRITDAREAAIKHIYDSIAPYPFFQSARRILDAGTGAGFPGIPLSIVLPDVRFVLAESIQKKARFLDTAVEELELPNVHVFAERAEEIVLTQQPDVVTARAVAPLPKLLDLFHKALRNGARLLLYKGPDVDSELAEAAKHRVAAEVVSRYELPDGMGTRTLIQITNGLPLPRKSKAASRR